MDCRTVDIWKDSEGIDRDVYRVNVSGHSKMIAIVTNDTVKVLGRSRGEVKHRGQIATAITEFFLNATEDIMPNYLIPTDQYLPGNMLLGRYCMPLPVRFVVRRYLTGSLYDDYVRGGGITPWGRLEDGLPHYYCFRDKELMLTPVIKADDGGYRPITEDEIVGMRHLTREDMEYVREKCFELFQRGEYLARKVGLVLADTKFEFGWNEFGRLVLIDELLTPDCSRYWQAQSGAFSDENPPLMEKSSEYLSSWIRRQAVKRGVGTDDVELPARVRREAYYNYAGFYLQIFGFPFAPMKRVPDPAKALRRYVESNFE